MNTTKKTVKYEDSAEYRKDLKGWACTECHRYWGEEEYMAHMCCANDIPCDCGKRITNRYSSCPECLEKQREERYQKRLNDATLCKYDDNPFAVRDKFYLTMEEYENDVEDEIVEPSEYAFMSAQICLELDADVIWEDAIERLEIDYDYDIDPRGFDDFKVALDIFVAKNKELGYWQEDNTRKFKLPTPEEKTNAQRNQTKSTESLRSGRGGNV